MEAVEVNKSHYQQHHDYVYDESEESEVASLYDLHDYHPPLKSRRLARTDAIIRAVSPDNTDIFENMHVECIKCGQDPYSSMRVTRQELYSLKTHQVHEPNSVIVAVEACHISSMDIAIRRGLYPVPLPFVLGNNFVGIVHDTREASKWRLGRRVAALSIGGCNSRFVRVSTDRLIDVPRKLDACEMAIVLSVYLPAFQALHHGQPRPRRYTQDALRRKIVLITGGALPESIAMVRLAQYAGASDIYVVAEREHHSMLRQLFVTPLDGHMDDWLLMVEGNMDVVVDFDFLSNQEAVAKALAPHGRLVWYMHPQKSASGNTAGLLWEQTKLCLFDRASIYDMYDESSEEHPLGLRMDLEFLLRLLQQRQIRPKIDQFIGLDGVKDAHQQLQNPSMSGALIVCEPWKDDENVSVNSSSANSSSRMSE